MITKIVLKRMMSLFTAIIMTLTMVTFFPMTSSAVSGKYGVLSYEVENGEVIITDCDKAVSGKVEIPGTIDGYPVKMIGNGAFKNYYGLTDVVIPDGVTDIGSEAFSGCFNLREINLPSSVVSIEHSAFSFCSDLVSVVIPDGVTNICDSTFSYCSNLENIVIPDSIMSIGSYAFYACHRLTGVMIPYGVTSIGRSAFESCGSLKSIVIPEGVNEICGSLFDDCRSLESIVIPKGITGIGYGVFYGCEALESIQVDENNPYYTSVDGVLYTKNKTKLICCPGAKKEVEILNSVTNIEWGAFYMCDFITDVVLPEGVTDIGGFAFYRCKHLTDIELPDSVKSIGYGAFEGCSALTDIVISDGVTSISSHTFKDCSSLTSIILPDSVKEIEQEAFMNCRNLTGITIPKGITKIEHGVFFGCNRLRSIVIPDGVTDIEVNAFAACFDLACVVIPDSVTSIKWRAFSGGFDIDHVLYSGTEDEWNRISIDKDNEHLTDATRHCEADLSAISEGPEIEPTCSSEGKIIYHCSVCDGEYYVTLPRTAHCSGEAVKSVDPTCVMRGYTVYRCHECGEEYNSDYVDALGHDWVADDGDEEDSRICSRCGRVYGTADLGMGYTDVKSGAWYYDAVNYALLNNLFNGTSPTTFEPDTAMTRGMLVQVLYNLEGRPESVGKESVFTDVKKDDWFAQAVIWAQENSIVYGTTSTKFSPNDKISREQLATILHRYSIQKGYDVTTTSALTSFPDADNISDYAESALRWAVGTGLISGNRIGSVNMLDARGNATRAQAATILRGFCERYVK